MDYDRVYVRVNADHMADGKVIPMILYWENEDEVEIAFMIDKILSVTPAHSRKVGGQGLLYRVMIEGREKSLFYDEFERRFFVEGKKRFA